MSSSYKSSLVDRLKRSKKARHQLVDSHVSKTLAFQIRATRESLGISQGELATRAGMNQNAIYRLESPTYGRPTLSTLKRIAQALDIALVVRFVPFSELVDWVSGTPRLNSGLNTGALAVPAFAEEEKRGDFVDSELRTAYVHTEIDRLDAIPFHMAKAQLTNPAATETVMTLEAAVTITR